ncbi:MAG: carbon starvation protein A [Planctomycetaceae bacterium]|nr:carbon starvation protein A [Planctomycetaceae bacterium]
MLTLLVAVLSFFGFIVAYNTYGRWLARSVFRLDPSALVPAEELRDDIDFVPTDRQVLFGHHFTSIAGTGPIVGPAIAVFWGWLPALLWVVFGSIFIGAVHDFGALVVSLRNRGQTLGEVAGRVITPRARVLFLIILFMALTVVLAVFGLVIAKIFSMYPESVLPTWASLPLAVGIGFWTHKRNGGLLIPSVMALAVVYVCVWLGAYVVPIDITQLFGVPETGRWVNVTTVWTVVLLVYCFFASVLPVWVMLQPRDYINSQQLVIALVLLLVGVLFAGLNGTADLGQSAPMVATPPADAPPIMPFLFITIACGACSGFHCLVSSGTTSKQVRNENDAQYVAYGSMLLEGALAVMVILSCCAGVGMGQFDRVASATSPGGFEYQPREVDGVQVAGRAAWESRYKVNEGWNKFKLNQMVQAFVEGGANFLTAIHIPIRLGISIIAVLVACFAATTLDSATRLQRYVVQELAATAGLKPLTNKFAATAFAILLAGWLASMPAPVPAGQQLNGGTGGLILWPLFGATNQLLAGLAFLVIVFYLWRRGRSIWFAAIPMLIMIVMPAWAMLWQMFNPQTGWWQNGKMLLFATAVIILCLQVWMIIEAFLLFPRIRGVVEEALPPLNRPTTGSPA